MHQSVLDLVLEHLECPEIGKLQASHQSFCEQFYPIKFYLVLIRTFYPQSSLFTNLMKKLGYGFLNFAHLLLEVYYLGSRNNT